MAGIGRMGAVALVGLAGTTGCPGVTKVDVQSSQQGLPEDVEMALQRSCRVSDGACHSEVDAGQPPGGFAFDAAGAFVETPVVQPGNLEGSSMFVEIEEGRMPIGGVELADADRHTLYGWIAVGAPLVAVDSGGVAGTDTGDASESSSESSGSSDESGSDTEVPEYDAFVPVLEIIQASCGGPNSCHRDAEEPGVNYAGLVLEDDVAYDNLLARAVVPSDLESILVDRVNSEDRPMPPPPADGLEQADIDTIVEWIENGAAP